ncbi:MAG: glycosyltransferase family A protein [Verrucomicrobia bacterium]|nr:glycosyltransferase family A protein [Verrucomicrobiota bacterium]
MPDLSIIIVSHNKPDLVREAIESVRAQTHTNWEAVVVDSGVLLEQGCYDFIRDDRFQVRASGETPELARRTNMASWCFNQILNEGSLTGELILYLCDDDLLYPEAFETFWKFYSDHNREPQAMYASQNIGVLERDGTTRVVGKRTADRLAGKSCGGKKLDCKVDYLQFCHTFEILKRFKDVYGTDRFHSEDKEDASHADGIFMEQIGALVPVHPIDKVLSLNRRTPGSANLVYSDTRFGRALNLMRAKFKGAWKRLRSFS